MCSGQQRGIYHPVDVGQAEIPSLILVHQAHMVQAHLIEDGGLEVLDVEGIPHGNLLPVVSPDGVISPGCS